jgi:hypothetical protein
VNLRVMRRLLYWFSFRIVGIPELNRLRYAERARIIATAQNTVSWQEMSNRRQIFWFLLFMHAQFVCGFLFFVGYGVLATLLIGGIAAGLAFDGRARYQERLHAHIRRLLDEKAKAQTKAKG